MMPASDPAPSHQDRADRTTGTPDTHVKADIANSQRRPAAPNYQSNAIQTPTTMTMSDTKKGASGHKSENSNRLRSFSELANARGRLHISKTTRSVGSRGPPSFLMTTNAGGR